jgi:acylaminoacyl-peptidase
MFRPAAGSVNQEVPSGMNDESLSLESIMGVPTIGKVQLVSQSIEEACMQVQMSQRNLPANSQRKSTINVFLKTAKDAPQVASLSHPIEQPSDLLLTSSSPSGASQVHFKSPNNAGGGETSLILQHSKGLQGIASELHVPKSLHGNLINDGYFASGVAWRPQEDAIAFTAEAVATEKTPAWGSHDPPPSDPKPPSASEPKAAPKTWKGVGVMLEDWGELNTGKRAPNVFLWDLARREIVRAPFTVEGQEEWSFGQPVWSRDGCGVLAVAWDHHASNFPSLAGKKLGVVFCYNRPCRILYLPVKREEGDPVKREEGVLPGVGQFLFGACQDLTSKFHSSALSPTFSPDGSALLFISHDLAVSSGTHGATAKLCSMAWPPPSPPTPPRVLVDVVNRASEPASFPGLYATTMLDEPFVDKGRLVLINTQWRSCTCIIAISASDGRVWPLTPTTSTPGIKPKSYSLSAIHDNTAFAICTSPLEPPHIVSTVLPTLASLSSSSSSILSWAHLNLDSKGSMSEAACSLLSKIDYSVSTVSPTEGYGDSSINFESILFFPKNPQAPLPALIVPHGGPHTAMSIGWYPAYAFIASLGYVLVCPNYRGSTGFGQDSLSSLPGFIGKNDVQDCLAALGEANDQGLVDMSRVAVVGGSHGGFLTAHLLGQHPDMFKAGVLRNPVCNLSLMVGVSDISDWCWIEAFGSEEGKKRTNAVPKPDDLAHLYSVSPIAHVDKVKGAMLFLLGAKDRRVPIVDGLQYVAALRVQGASEAARKPRVINFPEDGHGLEKPQSEFENWINAAWWLKDNV